MKEIGTKDKEVSASSSLRPDMVVAEAVKKTHPAVYVGGDGETL